MSPRARAVATGALLGDPPPGRTPWAAPARADEFPRTGMSPATAKHEAPPPQFASVDEIRPDEDVAPKLAISGPKPAPQPASTGFGRGAEHGASPDNMDAAIQGTGLTMDASPPLSTDVEKTELAVCDKSQTCLADTLRPVAPQTMLVRADVAIPTAPPMVEWMAPTDLLIEGRYQRDISQASDALIRRVVQRWDWRRFKPPVVAWTERGFEIIDGQHTAIAAATRGIEKIPVLVIEAAEVEDRAAAFIGHNRDRVAVTPPQMHVAAVAAGDEDAMTVQQVLDRAGARLLTKQWGKQKYRPGDTMAVAAIGALVGKRGAMKARQVLELLVKAEVAPISAAHLKAVDMLMSRPEYAEIDLEHLPVTIRDLDDVETQAKHDAKTFACPVWEAMGRIWFSKCRKQRRAA